MTQQTVRGIGQRVVELRKKNELTQVELAKKLNTNRSSLNMWERGERELKAGDLRIIADFFNVTVDSLIYDREAQNIDIYRATGLSQEAIETLKQFKKFDDAFIAKDEDETPITAGWCDTLSIAISSFDFLSTVVRVLSIKSGEPGIDDSANFNNERKIYECAFSPDMYAAAMTARLSLVLESLRAGKGGELTPYTPTTKEREQSFQSLLNSLVQYDLKTKGEDAK